MHGYHNGSAINISHLSAACMRTYVGIYVCNVSHLDAVVDDECLESHAYDDDTDDDSSTTLIGCSFMPKQG